MHLNETDVEPIVLQRGVTIQPRFVNPGNVCTRCMRVAMLCTGLLLVVRHVYPSMHPGYILVCQARSMRECSTLRKELIIVSE